jgi:hypothetical protein
VRLVYDPRSSVFKASSRRRLGDKASRKMRRLGRLIFSALLFFPYFSPFPGIFLVIWRRLALPRLRRRLKGKKGVNRHSSPYRLKNYDPNLLETKRLGCCCCCRYRDGLATLNMLSCNNIAL